MYGHVIKLTADISGTTPLLFNDIMLVYSNTDSGLLCLSWKQL